MIRRTVPLILFGDDFYSDKNRITRWEGFLKGIKSKEDIDFTEIGKRIKENLWDYWQQLKQDQPT